MTGYHIIIPETPQIVCSHENTPFSLFSQTGNVTYALSLSQELLHHGNTFQSKYPTTKP